MLFCLLSRKMETVCPVIVVFSRFVFMKTFQIICLYDPNKCAISCLVFCWATGKVFSMIALLISISSFSNCSRVSCRQVWTGKVFSMIALLISISSFSNCSRVSCRQVWTGRSAGHCVNRCCSLSVVVLPNGHFVSVGLIGVMLHNNRNFVSFSL